MRPGHYIILTSSCQWCTAILHWYRPAAVEPPKVPSTFPFQRDFTVQTTTAFGKTGEKRGKVKAPRLVIIKKPLQSESVEDYKTMFTPNNITILIDLKAEVYLGMVACKHDTSM